MAYLKVQVWIHRDKQVLLLKTTPKRGGFWQPVTGKVEPGESVEEGALREAVEETGLDFKGQQPRALGFEFSFEGKWGAAHEHAFALVAPSKEIRLDPKEHVEFQWLTPKKAQSLLKFDSNREPLALLVKSWGSTK